MREIRKRALVFDTEEAYYVLFLQKIHSDGGSEEEMRERVGSAGNFEPQPP